MKKLIYCSIVFLLCQIVTVSHAYNISNLTYEIIGPVGKAQASFTEASGLMRTYAEAGCFFDGRDFGNDSSASVLVSGRLHVDYGQEVYLDFTHAGEVIGDGENSFASGYFHFEMEGISITSQMLADSFSGVDSQFYYSSANGEIYYLLSSPDANKHWFTIPYATEAWDFSYTMSSVAEVLDYDPGNPSINDYALSNFQHTGSVLFSDILPVGADSVVINSQPVPTPTTMLLLGSGLVGLAGFRRRFRKG